jgi:hypothetical protein
VERGDIQSAAWSRALLLEALARLGRPSEGLQVVPDLDRLGDGERTWLHIALAVSRTYADDVVGAREAVDAALGIAERAPPVGYFLGAPLASLAEVTTRLWERALRDGGEAAKPSEQRARRAWKLLRSFEAQCPFVGPYVLLWGSTHRWLSGAKPRARRGWERALERARAFGMTHAEATTLAEQGVRLLDRAALEAALTIFERVAAALA